MEPTATIQFEHSRSPIEAVRLQRLGAYDPTIGWRGDVLWRCCRTPYGPGSMRVRWTPSRGRVEGEAWGRGGPWLAAQAFSMLGGADDPDAFQPAAASIRRLSRRRQDVALGRAARVFDTVVSYVLQQRVRFTEAAASWGRVVRWVNEPAPGPLGLLLPPTPQQWSAISPAQLASFGIDAARGRTVHEVARLARRIDALAGLPGSEVGDRLEAIRGIGPWTAAMVRAVAMGDADAVPVGDWSIPSLVASALAGEARADDARMLDLLRPYQPHRFRLIRLLMADGHRYQRRGPRRAEPHRRLVR